MSRGSSEFVIQRSDKFFASGISAFGDAVEVEHWVSHIESAERVFGDKYANFIAGKLGGISINVDSEYGSYED
jgi:hypothetical protein